MTRNVTRNGLKGVIADADGLRLDTIGTKLAGEPEFGDGFAIAGLGPGAVEAVIEPVKDVTGEAAFGLGRKEAREDVEEERADGVGGLGGRRDGDGGLAGASGPGAAGKVG